MPSAAAASAADKNGYPKSWTLLPNGKPAHQALLHTGVAYRSREGQSLVKAMCAPAPAGETPEQLAARLEQAMIDGGCKVPAQAKQVAQRLSKKPAAAAART